MKNSSSSKTNFDLWLLIGKAQHSIMLIRQRELIQYHIPIRQLHVLRTIMDLGSRSTLMEVAKEVEREPHAISKQSARMEKDGLIKRIKKTPKSNLLKLELTDRGLALAQLAQQSESIDLVFSVLSREEREMLEIILNKIAGKAKNLNST